MVTEVDIMKIIQNAIEHPHCKVEILKPQGTTVFKLQPDTHVPRQSLVMYVETKRKRKAFKIEVSKFDELSSSLWTARIHLNGTIAETIEGD